MKSILSKLKQYLGRLSFRTGVMALGLSVVFYIASFAQVLLPFSAEVKWALWVVFFGLAKTAQYSGLAIVGVDGYKRIQAWFKRDKQTDNK